jgi:formylglycine-generating enzyme required for sulfatase activity
MMNLAHAGEKQGGKIFKDCPDCPEMVEIPTGSYMMGSKIFADAQPVHRVTIKKPFAIGKTEITQGQWKAIMGNNPSYFKECGDDCPVTTVSFDEVQEFIKKLNAKTGKQYRLPSESEWEYACYAGKHTKYCGGDDFDSVAWFADNSQRCNYEDCLKRNMELHAVAQKQPNAWGLYDMSGNVSEYVADISIIFANMSNHKPGYSGYPNDGSPLLQSSVKINTVGMGGVVGDNVQRITRGGSRFNSADLAEYRRSVGGNLNTAKDYGKYADVEQHLIGFRLARSLP